MCGARALTLGPPTTHFDQHLREGQGSHPGHAALRGRAVPRRQAWHFHLLILDQRAREGPGSVVARSSTPFAARTSDKWALCLRPGFGRGSRSVPACVGPFCPGHVKASLTLCLPRASFLWPGVGRASRPGPACCGPPLPWAFQGVPDPLYAPCFAPLAWARARLASRTGLRWAPVP